MDKEDFFDNISIYEGIKQGLEEVLAFKGGDLSKATVRILSDRSSSNKLTYNPSEITSLRKTLEMSQSMFAYKIGVSPRTVAAWESGKSTPSGVATRMLYLIENDHSIVDRLLYR